jgi:tetraacyldisaccharide 4'-kinase
MRAPDFWNRDDIGARLAVGALSPLGWAYGAVTDWKRRHAIPFRPQARVICVGNLTAGGSGKTPIVLAIAAALRAQGRNAVILSRGYGGRFRDAGFVDPKLHAPRDVGDEPLMLARSVPVIVSRDRRAGAELADAHGADVIVMDDGHQNFQLEKNLSIVVVDAEKGFGNGRILPAGPLRESVRAGLARADGVVLVGAGSPELPGYQGTILRASLEPRDGAGLRGMKLVAFAGIGRPEKFFDTLRRLDAVLVDTLAFPDHHNFTAAEIARLKSKAKGEGALLVTTEKDFVRLTAAESKDILPVPVEARFEDASALEHLVAKAFPRTEAP